MPPKGMLKVFKFMINLIIALTLFSIAVNVPSVWNTYTTIRKVEKVMIKFAQKNGGFVTDEGTRGADELFNDLVTNYNLQDKINNVIFTPSIGTKVQKAIVNKEEGKFSISIEPKIEYVIPFVGPRTFIGKPIVEYGYSHKFFK